MQCSRYLYTDEIDRITRKRMRVQDTRRIRKKWEKKENGGKMLRNVVQSSNEQPTQLERISPLVATLASAPLHSLHNEFAFAR